MTFGCRLNIYESEIIRDHVQKNGLKNTIVFNTCAVTSEAERQARQAIRKAKRDNPEAYIIVTGCAAQIHPDAFAQMPEVSRVLGNEDKLKKENFFLPQPESPEKNFITDIMTVQDTTSHLVTRFEKKARAFVQVQNGCDHRCTFCIIPFGRGNSRSVPLGFLVEQVKDLVEKGFEEIVLTGVDITAYGTDLFGKPQLGRMVQRLLDQVPQLSRLRLTSLDPIEVDEDFFSLIQNEQRLMPYLHLSLQAGDDMILRRMKRRHLRQDAIDFCQRIKSLRSDVVFGADLIAGFPTETDAMFENSLDLIERCNLTYLHVFPFSPRPGTPAARMPQVIHSIRKQRAALLRHKGEEALEKFFTQSVGKTVHVLVEKAFFGHDQYSSPVWLDQSPEIGKIVSAVVTGFENQSLKAICV